MSNRDLMRSTLLHHNCSHLVIFKVRKKKSSTKPGKTNCAACLVLAGMVGKNKTVAVCLLLVRGIQINKKLER